MEKKHIQCKQNKQQPIYHEHVKWKIANANAKSAH